MMLFLLRRLHLPLFLLRGLEIFELFPSSLIILASITNCCPQYYAMYSETLLSVEKK